MTSDLLNSGRGHGARECQGLSDLSRNRISECNTWTESQSIFGLCFQASCLRDAASRFNDQGCRQPHSDSICTTRTIFSSERRCHQDRYRARNGEAETGVTVLTDAVPVKETGPEATVKKFDEVYAFSSTFIAVHRDQPT